MAVRRNDPSEMKKAYGALLTVAGFIRTAADSLVANNAVDGQANVLLKELMGLTGLEASGTSERTPARSWRN